MATTRPTSKRPVHSFFPADSDPTDPASAAWQLMLQLMVPGKPRFVSIAQEFDLAPQQAGALRMLVEPTPMHELAKALHCDRSNVTGIVDRLEKRGLVRRDADADDRRVKLLVLTEEGDRVRREINRRMAKSPPELKALPKRDQEALRDLLLKAFDAQAEAEIEQ